MHSSLDEAEVIRHHGIVRPLSSCRTVFRRIPDMAPSQPDVLYAEQPVVTGPPGVHVHRPIGFVAKGARPVGRGFGAVPRSNEAALVLAGPEYRGSRHALATLAERFGVSSDLVFSLNQHLVQDRANLFAAADVFAPPIAMGKVCRCRR